MALKFLNKKGWHTGSLRNIENVWKAEQKHEAEQRKLEELRKQIQDEREKHEFRLLQEQAGLQPRQERLDFLYESGLAVGKGSSEGFQALQQSGPTAAASSSAQASAGSSQAAAPGALFEDKPQSANDAWRKLHSDPLLLIRQREQAAIARIKNNPIKMAEIKKSVEAEKKQKEEKKERRKHKKHHHRESKSKRHHSDEKSDSEETYDGKDDRRKRSHHSPEHTREEKSSRHEKKHRQKDSSDSEEDEPRRRRQETSKLRDRSDADDRKRRHYSQLERHHAYPKYESSGSRPRRMEDERMNSNSASEHPSLEDRRRQISQQGRSNGSTFNRRRGVHHMSEEEREARLRQMQVDAELHEDQRWKRLKKAADDDAKEAASTSANQFRGKNFLDDEKKSVFGAEKGGSSTIEESIRRRAYYSQGGHDAHEHNAFRR